MAAYRYHRIYIKSLSNGVDYASIAEVELRAVSGGPDVTTPATLATASTEYPGLPASYLVDNDATTHWSTNGVVDTLNPCWIAFDLGSPQEVVEIAITAEGALPNRAPKTFAFQSSSDGVTWPTFVQTIADQSAWASYEKRVFTVKISFFSGSAKLDSGLRADLVQIYDWSSPYDLQAAVVPNSDGSWSANAPVSSALIVVRGPSGYQPVSHGPVTPAA